MSSSARKALTRLMSARAVGGVLLVPKDSGADGADLPPGSMAYPPCQCPRHRDKPTVDPMLSANKRKR